MLKVSILGVFLVFVANVILFPEGSLNTYISFLILITCLLTYAIRNRYPTTEVLLFTSVVMGITSKKTHQERLQYGAQCFAYFIVALFGIGWAMKLGHG